MQLYQGKRAIFFDRGQGGHPVIIILTFVVQIADSLFVGKGKKLITV